MLESVVVLADVVTSSVRAEWRRPLLNLPRNRYPSIRWDVAGLIFIVLGFGFPAVNSKIIPIVSVGGAVTFLLLQVVNPLLVHQLLRQLTGNGWLAAMVAAMFAVHPVQFHQLNLFDVGFLSAPLLPSTFLLAAAACWLKRDRTSRDERWGTVWLLAGLAVHAPVVILLPLVIVFDVLVVRRNFMESVFRQLVPVFFCIMLMLTMMNAQVTLIDGLRNHNGLSKWRLLAIDSNLLGRYVGMLLTPQDLSLLCHPPIIGGAGLVLVMLMVWGLLGAWLWTMRHWEPFVTIRQFVWHLVVAPVIPWLSIRRDLFCRSIWSFSVRINSGYRKPLPLSVAPLAESP